jgi:hypothetical protein
MNIEELIEAVRQWGVAKSRIDNNLRICKFPTWTAE